MQLGPDNQCGRIHRVPVCGFLVVWLQIALERFVLFHHSVYAVLHLKKWFPVPKNDDDGENYSVCVPITLSKRYLKNSGYNVWILSSTQIETVCSLANYSVAYEETQSNRVSDFRDSVCSLFPKAILFLHLLSFAVNANFSNAETHEESGDKLH